MDSVSGSGWGSGSGSGAGYSKRSKGISFFFRSLMTSSMFRPPFIFASTFFIPQACSATAAPVSLSITGPPELPPFVEASYCTFCATVPPSVPILLIFPPVTVESSSPLPVAESIKESEEPGYPIMVISCPTISWVGTDSFSGTRLSVGFAMPRIAMSLV